MLISALSPTEPWPVIGLKGANMTLRLRVFSAIMSEIGSLLFVLILAITNFEETLDGGGWFHVEFWRRGVDHLVDDARQIPARVCFSENKDTRVYFREHLPLCGSHGVEYRLAAHESGNNCRSPLL